MFRVRGQFEFLVCEPGEYDVNPDACAAAVTAFTATSQQEAMDRVRGLVGSVGGRALTRAETISPRPEGTTTG